MHRDLYSLRLLAGASLLALCAAGAQAQTSPSVVNDNAAQQTIERTQDDATLEQLRRDAKKNKKREIDTEKAAKQLQGGDEMSVLGNVPTMDKLTALKEAMQAQPNNLDYYFAYAQMAGALGMYDEAAATYEKMLALAPQLDRVRLDLGATYLKLGRFDDARRELNAVLAKNPPEQVQSNVRSVLAQIDNATKEHLWGGSVAVGLNYDTNGNSAPDGGQILIFDTPVTLTGTQRRQHDVQGFAAASLNHSWAPLWARSKDMNARWDSTLSLYQTEQADLDDLDLKVLSLETGPSMRWANGLMLHPKVGYQHIVLDTSTYQKNLYGDLEAEYQLSAKWALLGGLRQERRDFDNAPGITVYSDRTGSASQASAGVRFMPTKQDILTAELTARRERTRQAYYDNDQLGGQLSYVHLFNEHWFSSASLGYKNSVYDDNDGLLSTRTRHDRETSAGLTIGRKLTDSITATAGYQYRDTQSSLPNYDYSNHRVSTSLSVRF